MPANSFFASFAYTGGKVADTNLFFDEQQALVGRLSDVFYSDADWKLAAVGAGTYVFRGGDATAGAGSARNITLQDGPELTIDDDSILRLVSTGALNARAAWNYGARRRRGVAQPVCAGRLFRLRHGPGGRGRADLNFDGWYVQGTWIITGESRPYNAANGSFSNPKPRMPFSLDGWGTGRVGSGGALQRPRPQRPCRRAGQRVPAGGIRGGDQRIFTAALNWYPNNVLKFALQWQHTEVNRIGTIPAGFGHGALNNAQVGQTSTRSRSARRSRFSRPLFLPTRCLGGTTLRSTERRLKSPSAK